MLVGFSCLSAAQDLQDASINTKFEVLKDTQITIQNKGFCARGDIDYQSIVSAFGIPDEFTPLQESRKKDLYGDPTYVKAIYRKDGKEDVLWFLDRVFTSFHLETDRFIACKNIVPGGIKVGDPISKITSLLPRVNQWDRNKDKYAYDETFEMADRQQSDQANFVVYNQTDYPICFRVEKGIIVWVLYDCSDF